MKIPRGLASRRDFIRQITLGGAVLSSGLAVPRLLADTAPAKRPLGVALLGLGTYASYQLAPALQMTKLCRLTGAISGHPAKLEHWKKQYGLPDKNCYGYEQLDQIADNKDIDIVYVVTPNTLHRDFVVRAAKAGKHVICEKPMGGNVADCEAMIAACQAAKVRLSVGYRMHFDPYMKELMRLQREKDFGDFKKLNGNFSFVFGQHAWRVEKKLAGGGPLMDIGIYVIQAACMAVGSTPIAATAKELPKDRPDFFVDVEEALSFQLEFANGAVLEAGTSYNDYQNRFRAEGDKGWIDFSDNAFSYQVGQVNTSRGALSYRCPSQQALQMDDFADCILTGRPSEVDGEMGRRDMRIIGAIYEASRTGKKVSI
ncbi:MAG TPA: Gfo/Idh/MocA family oxidoreductase [Verrucomicrobiae bacterium]